MKTRIADLVLKSAAVAGLVAGLALGGGFAGIEARETDPDNYFLLHPGPLGGRTDIDPNDPYAPVDLGGSAIGAGDVISIRAAGRAAATGSEWDVPPMPGLPGRPY